jgi:environmental stress-induced protein Ves
VPAFADPVGGPVTDLNVMTRRGRFDCRFERRIAPAPIRLTPRSGTRVIVALSDLSVRIVLTHRDLVLGCEAMTRTRQPQSHLDQSPASGAVTLATPTWRGAHA